MILSSITNTTGKAVAAYAKRLNDVSKLCFGAAVGCFIVGMLGWIVNFFAAESTMLHGLLVVATFYFALGVIKLFEKRAGYPNSIAPTCEFNDQLQSPERDLRTEEKRLDPAA